VRRPRREGGERLTAGHGDGCEGLIGRAIAQLAGPVVAPTPRGAGGGEAAGVG
jgi:hypothetical protein